MPEYIRESYRSELQANVPAEFRFGTEGASPNKLSFARLSKVTATLQQIWSALASTLGNQELTLNAMAFVEGSFAVRVEANNRELFARVATIYRELNRATYDEAKLTAVLSRLPRPIVDNYSQYLSALNVNKLEVFTEWRETTSATPATAYVGYNGVQRTRRAIKQVRSLSDNRQQWIETLTGYFEGFLRKSSRFEFYNAVSGNRVSGKIQKSLRDTPITGELYLGHRLKYRAEIEIMRNDNPNMVSIRYSILPASKTKTPPISYNSLSIFSRYSSIC